MKTTMKTVFVSLLLLCMATSVFAAGGRDQASAPAESGPVTIELWYGLSMTETPPPPPDWKVLQLVRDKLNINLVISALPSSENDQTTKINAAAAANSLPDLLQLTRDSWVSIVKTGLLAPVDDLYAQMPNRTRLMHDAEAIAFTTYNGKSYGFANLSVIPRNEGVVIRKDWLDKLGLQIPVTTEDYLNVMRAFTTRDPDGNGRNDTYGFGAFLELLSWEEGLGRRFDPFFGAFGVAGTWDLRRSSPGLVVRKPAYYDALAYIKQMIDERIIDPNWVSYSKDDFRAAWKQGRFGIMREQNAALAAESNYAPFDANFPNGEWIVIDPPRGPSGQQAVGVAANGFRTYSVSTKAMNAGKGPAIARLLDWMVSDEGYYMLGWGERGVNYVIGPDGAPTINGIPDASKGWSRPEIVSMTQLRNMVFYNSQVEMISRYPTYKAPTSGRSMSALDVLYDMQRRPWTNNNGAEVLPPPNADVKRFYEQGVVEFMTGTRQLTRQNWTTWVSEFDRMGGLDWERAGVAAADAGGYLK